MSGDGKIDGKFVISDRLSFYNAISQEMGLDESEKNMISGSLWNKIYDVIVDENTRQTDLGTKDGLTLIKISKDKFKDIVDQVNKALNKNISIYDEKAVDNEYEKLKVSLPALQSEKLTQDLKKELQSGWVNQSNAKKLLAKINPGNVASIVNNYPEIADDIDGVFALGFGFDKNEVFKHILYPILYRAKELEIPVSENITKESSLEEMKTAIKYYTSKILAAENGNSAGDMDYESAQQAFNSTSRFLAELSTGNNNSSKTIHNTKYEDLKETSKYLELEDGRSVHVIFDESGEIQMISVKTSDDSEITYTEENAGPVNDFNIRGFNPVVSGRDYDFNALKKIVKNLFDIN